MKIESNSHPSLSVIVPVYNVEKFLKCCLNSIASQTYTNYECILIDDGSTDNSGKICDEFSKLDSRFKVIHKKNGGVSSARNTGLSEAKGKVITFIDSDDTVEKRCFESYMKYIELCDWVMLGVRSVDCNLTPTGLQSVFDDSNRFNWEIQDYDKTLFNATHSWMVFGPIWNKAYKTDIIRCNKLQFVSTTNINEDRIFNIEYAGYAKSAIIEPYVAYNYVENPNSITRKYIKTETFLHTAIEMDNVLKKNLLSNYMKRYTANFACRFFIRSVINNLTTSSKFISTSDRFKLFKSIFHCYFNSTTFKKYGINNIKWGFFYIIEALSKRINK